MNTYKLDTDNTTIIITSTKTEETRITQEELKSRIALFDNQIAELQAQRDNYQTQLDQAIIALPVLLEPKTQVDESII